MFDRFVLASSYKRISERFNRCYINSSSTYKPSYNIVSGDESYVILNYQTKEIHQFHFGLTGITNDPVLFVRAEGDRNQNNNPDYTGSKAIFLKSEFGNLIRKQRCLVLADAFIVGINKTPCLVHLRNKQRPFAFAGIWNKNKDESGKDVYSFAIITVTANKLLQKLGYKRMPVILYPNHESNWLKQSAQLSDILYMLTPYPDNKMNAYPVSKRIIDTNLNDLSLIQPVERKILTITKSANSNLKQEVVTDNNVVLSLTDKAKRFMN